MRRAWIAGVILFSLALVSCGGSTNKPETKLSEVTLSEGEEWSVFESLMAESPGWTKQQAHELRLLVQREGDSAHRAERCYEGRLLPGEWPNGCEAYARFEAKKGIDSKGQGELDSELAATEKLEKECGPALYAHAHLAEGPQGTTIPTLAIGCADIGKGWPLTVRRGTLQCEELLISEFQVQRVTFKASDGSVYGVNGSALDAGYPPIDPIWKDDPSGTTPKVNIGPLISRGLHLCERFE